MKKLIFILTLLLPLTVQAITGTANSIGDTTYFYFNDGTSGHSNQIGDTTYFYFNDGTSGTATNIGGITHYNYNIFSFDRAISNYNINLSSDEKVMLFEEADEKKDFQVFFMLNTASNEQCKLETIKQYNNFKKVLKDISLTHIKDRFGAKSVNDEIEDCNEAMGGGTSVVSPSIAILCLQNANNNRNSYLKSINSIYQQALNDADFTKTYSDCINVGCAEGYKWNEKKTFCVKKSIDIQNTEVSANNSVNDTIINEKKFVTTTDNKLSNNLKGKILLQVEQNGEGWYVNPDNQKKYYLGRPADAFSIMRNLGLGIKHSELTTYLNSKFPSRLSGKILLDVERNGEAYYVNPNDLKGYYLNRPADAFKIMREFGLGITNTDIRKIDVGEIK
jgi:hypothetical protein